MSDLNDLSLSEQQKQIVVLRMAGVSYEEISLRLNISMKEVLRQKKLIHEQFQKDADSTSK